MKRLIQYAPVGGLALAVVLLIVVESFAVINLNALAQNHQAVIQTLQVLSELETIQSQFTDIESAERDFIITNDPAVLADYTAAIGPGGLLDHVARLRQLTAGDSPQQQRLDTLDPILAEELATAQRIILLTQQYQDDQARLIIDDPAEQLDGDRVLHMIVQMRMDENDDLTANTATDASRAQYAAAALVAGSSLAVLAIVAVLFMLNRQLNGRRRAEAALGQLNAELEQRVSARTAELAQANQTLTAELADRQRAERALNTSEQQLRSTLDNMMEGAQIIGADWRYMYVNNALVTQGRQPRQALLGHTMMEIYPGLEQTELFGVLRQSMTQRVQAKLESPFTFPDGSQGWFEISVQPMGYGLFILSHDITERKQSEMQIQRQVERLAALRAIDQAITSSLDVQLTLAIFLEQVTTQLGVDAADVMLLDRGDQMLHFAAGRGLHIPELHKVRVHLGEGHVGRAVLERKVVSANLALEQPGSRRTGLLLSNRFSAYFGVPLVAKGQALGALEIFHHSPLAPDAEWMGFLEALAGQAAIAIDSAQLFEGLQRLNMDLQVAYDATIEGWSRALDLRDKETEGHSQRVTELTLELAQTMGFSDAELVHIRRGALLHDIGKLGVPDSILLKPGPLTDEEWAIMRRHPALAYELLNPINYLRPALNIPYCHHEKWDGSGYPRGLAGDAIPRPARVFAVVDVWDALRSDRPYRAAWPAERVRALIREQAGKHFDPAVVEAFLQMQVGGQPGA